MHGYSKYLESYLHKHWQKPTLLGWIILWPCSILFSIIAIIRKFIYKKIAYYSKVPVIIVGNISVGGTGKTPVVIYIAQFLKKNGYNPGVVTRGYKSKIGNNTVFRVSGLDDPYIVGHEPVLLAQKTKCQVIISKHRTLGVKLLENQVDVIICDDGLQHYLLARDIEIALIDYKQFGNGFCLPMGPLREPRKRLQNVDVILEHGKDFKLIPEELVQSNEVTIHAVAGIGNPYRFFSMLRQYGFKVIEHVFPDHYIYKQVDLQFNDEYPIYMTEKDAVKCKNFTIKNLHVIKVNAQLNQNFNAKILALLKEKQYAR